MDVLKPDLIWIDGKCYRIPYNTNSVISNNDSTTIQATTQAPDKHCALEEDMEGNCDDSADDDSVQVKPTPSGRLYTSLHVPQTFFGCIIGPKGDTRKLIEQETGTVITIPRNKIDCEVGITGAKRADVLRARRRLLHKVWTARQKQRPTHFLSIPMTGKQIQNSFLKFKEEVCQNCNCTTERVDSSVFQTPVKLHLTLGTMVLGDDFEVEEVAEMLQSFKETSQNELLRGEPIKIQMRGVEYMNDDPTEVDILFGRVKLEDESDSLQRLADDLFKLFAQRGFITERREKVKLHVTLMNTKFREGRGPGAEPPRRMKRETFDARFVLENFQDFDFGVQQVDSVHLSQRFTSNAEGYYNTVGSMKL